MLGRSYISMSFETLNLHEPAVFLAEMFLSGCMNKILFHITALYSNQKTGHKENHAMFSYSFCFLITKEKLAQSPGNIITIKMLLRMCQGVSQRVIY